MQPDPKERWRKLGAATRGETKGTAKLTSKSVRHIRTSCESANALSELYGVNPRHIRAIRHGDWWKHLEDNDDHA